MTKKTFKKPILFASTLLLCASLLQGCSGIEIGAGAATATGMAASREGGIGQAIEDFEIRAQINDLWFRHDIDMYNSINLTIEEGRVLLTGQVQDPDMRVDAVRLAWQANGVKQVINEIRVEKGRGVLGYAKDTLITTKLRARITFDKEINALNYTIDAVGGTVYLMGVAQNRDELQRVIDHARDISHVRDVVSYVRVLEGEGAQEPVDETFEEVEATRYSKKTEWETSDPDNNIQNR